MNTHFISIARGIAFVGILLLVKLPDPGFYSKVHPYLVSGLALLIAVGDMLVGGFKKTLVELPKSDAIPESELDAWHKKISANRRYARKLWLTSLFVKAIAIVCGVCLQFEVPNATTHPHFVRVILGLTAYGAILVGIFLVIRAWSLSEHAEEATLKLLRLSREKAEEAAQKTKLQAQAEAIIAAKKGQPESPDEPYRRI